MQEGYDQIVFAWAGESSGRGYQIIAATEGLSRDDLNFASSNALPNSFSTGDFRSCIRGYILPSGKLSVSFIASAGKDLLGRSGTYYSHSIIFPSSAISNGELFLSDLYKSFVKDEKSIDILIQAFKGRIISLPPIIVERNSMQQRPVHDVFKSGNILAALLQHLFKGGTNIVIGIDGEVSGYTEFMITDLIYRLIPGDILPISFSTFSNAYPTEFSVFRVIFAPSKKLMDGTFSSQHYLLIDPTGAYFPYNPSHITDQLRELADYLLNGNMNRVRSIYEKYGVYRTSSGSLERIRFAVLEASMEENPVLPTIIRLYENPIDPTLRQKYRSYLIKAGKDPKNLDQYVSYFETVVSDSTEQDTFNRNFEEGFRMILAIDNKEAIDRFMKSVIHTSRVKRFTPQYNLLFNSFLEHKSDRVDQALSGFIAGNPAVLDDWVKYVSRRGEFVPFSEITPILDMMDDRKSIRKFVESVYFKANVDHGTKECIEFLTEYMKSDRFEPDTGLDIYKSLIKKVKSSVSNSEKEMVLSFAQDLKEKGIEQKDLDKLAGKLK